MPQKMGIPVTIYRIGNLTGRYTDGKFQKNIRENYFYNEIQFYVTNME